jgi:hypothetical protein
MIGILSVRLVQDPVALKHFGFLLLEPRRRKTEHGCIPLETHPVNHQTFEFRLGQRGKNPAVHIPTHRLS